MSISNLKEKLQYIDDKTKAIEKAIIAEISKIPLKEKVGHFEDRLLKEKSDSQNYRHLE